MYHLLPMFLCRGQSFICHDLWPFHGFNHLQKVAHLFHYCVSWHFRALGVNLQMWRKFTFKIIQHLNETIVLVSREQETNSCNESWGIFSCCRMDSIGTKNDCWLKTKGISLGTKAHSSTVFLLWNLIKHRINFNFHITTEAQIFQGCTYRQ